jgi:hypothetical protein
MQAGLLQQQLLLLVVVLGPSPAMHLCLRWAGVIAAGTQHQQAAITAAAGVAGGTTSGGRGEVQQGAEGVRDSVSCFCLQPDLGSMDWMVYQM